MPKVYQIKPKQQVAVSERGNPPPFAYNKRLEQALHASIMKSILTAETSNTRLSRKTRKSSHEHEHDSWRVESGTGEVR